MHNTYVDFRDKIRITSACITIRREARYKKHEVINITEFILGLLEQFLCESQNCLKLELCYDVQNGLDETKHYQKGFQSV